MKREFIRAWPVVGLLFIPFIYNSCQGGLFGSKGFSSSKSECKLVLEKGAVTKLDPNQAPPAGVFDQKKVRLRDDLDPNSAMAKASAPLELAAGDRLGVIINNRCLADPETDVNNTTITKAAFDSGETLAELDRQAYEWVLDRNYEETEIESLAASEACVVGLSWNKEYRVQSFNDSGLLYQTHLAAIRADESYPLFYNSGGGMSTTGSPVTIAVVDTGVDYQHTDLVNNMWAHTNGVGIDITTLNTNLVDYNPFDASDIGHGTHVAGLIAAVSNNNQGIMGTMPHRARIMAIKVFELDEDDELVTSSQHVYNAIRFAYLNGADVVNVSLGSITDGASTDSVAEAGVDEAIADGVVVVTVIGNASGNDDGELINGTTLSSIPGQFATKAGVLGVGSIDVNTGQKSFFSHYSPTYAEIAAPGAEEGSTGIYSTLPGALSSYGRLAGTSQAAPLVSAAAGMVIGILREAYNVSPTPAEVERLILASAVKDPALTTYFKQGNRLD
ncbi:MAG: S8 family serine peptidase [Bdellovibrionales bacterium]